MGDWIVMVGAIAASCSAGAALSSWLSARRSSHGQAYLHVHGVLTGDEYKELVLQVMQLRLEPLPDEEDGEPWNRVTVKPGKVPKDEAECVYKFALMMQNAAFVIEAHRAGRVQVLQNFSGTFLTAWTLCRGYIEQLRAERSDHRAMYFRDFEMVALDGFHYLQGQSPEVLPVKRALANGLDVAEARRRAGELLGYRWSELRELYFQRIRIPG